jgi:hypothetical protein
LSIIVIAVVILGAEELRRGFRPKRKAATIGPRRASVAALGGGMADGTSNSPFEMLV